MNTLCDFIIEKADVLRQEVGTILVSHALMGEARQQAHGFTAFLRNGQGRSFQKIQDLALDGSSEPDRRISSNLVAVVGADFEAWGELRALMQRIGAGESGSVVVLVPAGQDAMSQASLSQFVAECAIRAQAFGFSGEVRIASQCDGAELGAVVLKRLRPATSLGKVLESLSPGDEGRVAVLTLGTRASGIGRSAPREPLFTVLTRTQGSRMETLGEVFLCLSAQTVDDFEHLVVAHNATPEAVSEIRALIDSQSASMRERIRFEEVIGGTRTTPLNAGFGMARGKYVIILDDDDIVFANWLETFRAIAREMPGALLRATAVRQEFTWAYVEGKRAARAISAMHRDYASQFDYFEHLEVSQTPPVSIAFPRNVFANYGLRFDETLTTTEDWDFIMRCASRVGVGSSEEITCIYRWWSEAESSRTLHSKSEWVDNHTRIQDKIDAEINLMEAGSMRKFREISEKMDEYLRWANKMHHDLIDLQLATNSNDVEEIKQKIAAISDDVQHEIVVMSGDSSPEVLYSPPQQDLLPPPRVPFWKKMISGSRAMAQMRASQRRKIIETSGIFDANWYLSTYLDVAEQKVDPLVHFIQFGSRELRSPSARFNARSYYVENADVRDQKIEPVFHFLLFGKREGRRYQEHV